MMLISSALTGEFRWSYNKNKQELKQGERVVGSLKKTSFWSSDYLAEIDHSNWKFSRCSMLGTSTEILDATSNRCIARCKTSWGRGTLTFSDGETFQIISKGCWRPVWSVLTQDGQTLVQLTPRDSAVGLPGKAASATSEERLVLLVLFLKYHMQHVAEDDGAVAAMIAVTS